MGNDEPHQSAEDSEWEATDAEIVEMSAWEMWKHVYHALGWWAALRTAVVYAWRSVTDTHDRKDDDVRG